VRRAYATDDDGENMDFLIRPVELEYCCEKSVFRLDARCDSGKVLAGLEDIRQFVNLEDKILKLVGPSG
jgi:hypothetical protein